MRFLKLRRKVLTLSRISKGDGKAPVRQGFPRVKIMTMLKATEKVTKLSRIFVLRSKENAKEANIFSKLIRTQLEELKRKVAVYSPAALRFIGPGDYHVNTIQRGVIISI